MDENLRIGYRSEYRTAETRYIVPKLLELDETLHFGEIPLGIGEMAEEP